MRNNYFTDLPPSSGVGLRLFRLGFVWIQQLGTTAASGLTSGDLCQRGKVKNRITRLWIKCAATERSSAARAWDLHCFSFAVADSASVCVCAYPTLPYLPVTGIMWSGRKLWGFRLTLPGHVSQHTLLLSGGEKGLGETRQSGIGCVFFFFFYGLQRHSQNNSLQFIDWQRGGANPTIIE